MAVFVLDELNRGGEVHHGDLTVENLVAQRAHDLCTGVVLGRVHTLARGAAAVGRDHGAVRRLVKLHAKAGQPLDGLGRFGDELVEKILLRGKVAAAIGVEEVLCR